MKTMVYPERRLEVRAEYDLLVCGAGMAGIAAAVNAAINAFNKELLASHIRGCVARDIREGKDEVIDELVATLQKLMK